MNFLQLNFIGLKGLLFTASLLLSWQITAKGTTEDSLKIEALLAIDSDTYTSINERRKFYKKASHLFTDYGYEIRWLKVAYKTVWSLQLAHGKITGFFAHSNDEIRQFIRNGNKIILDDMLDKVREMWRTGNVLKGHEAMLWDAQMLSDEQALIDPAYERLLSENQIILDDNLKGCISRKILRNPTFKGFITHQEDRWAFGMEKMGYYVKPDMMPIPNSNWENVKLKIIGKGKKLMMIKAY